jgi:hypothetical protein
VFFDTGPAKAINAKGMTYEEIQRETRSIVANGGTAIGSGLMYILEKGIEVDGIAIVSDGAEHQYPAFASTYKRYCDKWGKDVPVYFYDLPGEPNVQLLSSMKALGFDIQIFDLRRGVVDYYSLPNLIKTMSTKRYGLVDQIMETPLLRLRNVFRNAEWNEIL